MNILILSHNLPSPDIGATLPMYHFIKNLANIYKHKIFVFSLKQRKTHYAHEEELLKFCDLETFEIPFHSSTFQYIVYSIKNMFSLQNIFSKNPSVLNYYYIPKIQTIINTLLTKEDFDLIYSDAPMACYVQNVKKPKIIQPLDAYSEFYHQTYKNSKNYTNKMFWYIQYLKMKAYEKTVYRKFNFCIVVTDKDKNILSSLLKKTKIEVIPNGVNINYFCPFNVEEEYPSLTFVGDMSTPPNIEAVSKFYDLIYIKLRKQFPTIKFYIVGKNPPSQIRQLEKDTSVIVTGYVNDVRPYLARTSVVVIPMFSGTGIKNKILEAMAMRKPVVSTVIGATGIDISPEENILIAHEEQEFERQLIRLLENKQMRLEIANNGRKLVQEKYSWEKSTHRLNELFEEIVTRHDNK